MKMYVVAFTKKDGVRRFEALPSEVKMRTRFAALTPANDPEIVARRVIGLVEFPLSAKGMFELFEWVEKERQRLVLSVDRED